MAGRRGIPPGTHIRASVPADDGGPRQARILGDDVRGYLIAGVSDLLGEEDDEFWFGSLDEALDCGERLGIERSAWTEIRDVSEAPRR
jgi:hypothetical protein